MDVNERRKRIKKESSSKLAAFEKLKQAKNEGKKHKYEVGLIENVYEEVSEKEYTDTVLKRQEDDWIVGDYGVEGYVEDGREIFDDDLDEESIKKNQKNGTKRNRFGTKISVEPPRDNIKKMIASMPMKRKREVKLDEDDILGSLMEELNSPSKMLKTKITPNDKIMEEKKKTEEYLRSFNSTPLLKTPKPIASNLNGTTSKPQFELENLITINQSSNELKIKSTNTNEFDELNIEPLKDESIITLTSDINFDKSNLNEIISKTQFEQENLIAINQSLSESKVKPINTNELDKFNELDNKPLEDEFKTTSSSNINFDENFKFFYWDAYEDVFNQPGKVFLFGKVWLESTQIHIFGTNTGYLELFLLERKIKGPSWLNICNAKPASHSVSWCKFELICDDIKNISVNVDGGAPPPLIVMALNIRITPLPKSHENQVIMIGWLVQTNYYTDKAAPSLQFKDNFCAFTKPINMMWPLDSKLSKEELGRCAATNLEKFTSERELLSFFLAKFHKIDPDLIVGHDIYGFDIGTLIHRLVVNKIMHWSRLGRLRRANVVNIGKGKNFAEKNVMCGRLLCDIKISAKELIRARSYDLDSLCEQVLHLKEGKKKNVKAEEVKEMYGSTESLINLIKLTMQDALYILRIMYDLNTIPLSLQITNIAGNVMSRTLMGGRSERNEYLLLHAFNDKNYIVPDKKFSKKTLKDDRNEDHVSEPTARGKRKPQYEGGLVLEPKKGFYDKLILLMDFNSLYPSIIQEYNICFTTISVRGISFKNEEDLTILMNYLPTNAEPGILPTEIKKLVESRRQVKTLMKKPDISSDLKHQYDIRQMALKLTANSMYGCLGFPNSRFYAKPLAAMVTAKGREILLNTRDLVQKLNFDVIYGDTDSLMINTNCVANNFDEVFNIGKKIKIEVNKLYKQIELDIDGVFQYMLLLKKKKYAAITLNKVNGKLISKQEIKGLDIVRRDWSQLSAEAGKFVLSQILSDQNLDDKFANIHARLRQLKIDLEENKVPTPLLAITKQLTKNPEEYPDKKSLPHVQVAIRMNLTMAKKFRQGDTIAYIICEDGTVNAATQRAYHVDELETNDKLKIDVKYYLSQQIHPVVTRLCEPIDGIDAVQIAEFLGLDPAIYHNTHRLNTSVNEDDEITLDETDRYKNCDRFEFKCSNANCGITNALDVPIIKNVCNSVILFNIRVIQYIIEDGKFIFPLERCCSSTCNSEPFKDLARIQNTLLLTMRNYIHKYYQHWMICEDPTCAYRTRNITMINKNLEPECTQCKRNNLLREFTESQLYNQLCYFHYIFDITAVLTKHSTIKLDPESELGHTYNVLKETVNNILKSNAYNIIDLRKISNLILMK
ncbi:hypothetical protein PGB90_004236 [Kerria lacca]